MSPHYENEPMPQPPVDPPSDYYDKYEGDDGKFADMDCYPLPDADEEDDEENDELDEDDAYWPGDYWDPEEEDEESQGRKHK